MPLTPILLTFFKMPGQNLPKFNLLIAVDIKDLLTECEVCTGKVCAIKTKAILSPTDRANEVNKGFIIWLC